MRVSPRPAHGRSGRSCAPPHSRRERADGGPSRLAPAVLRRGGVGGSWRLVRTGSAAGQGGPRAADPPGDTQQQAPNGYDRRREQPLGANRQHDRRPATALAAGRSPLHGDHPPGTRQFRRIEPGSFGRTFPTRRRPPPPAAGIAARTGAGAVARAESWFRASLARRCEREVAGPRVAGNPTPFRRRAPRLRVALPVPYKSLHPRASAVQLLNAQPVADRCTHPQPAAVRFWALARRGIGRKMTLHRRRH